jgi:hypothetical protein
MDVVDELSESLKKRELGMKPFSFLVCTLPTHIRLDASALIYKTINSDQFYKTQSLILEIRNVLTAVTIGEQSWYF